MLVVVVGGAGNGAIPYYVFFASFHRKLLSRECALFSLKRRRIRLSTAVREAVFSFRGSSGTMFKLCCQLNPSVNQRRPLMSGPENVKRGNQLPSRTPLSKLRS